MTKCRRILQGHKIIVETAVRLYGIPWFVKHNLNSPITVKIPNIGTCLAEQTV